MGAHGRERVGLAEPRRHAAAEALPDRGLLARGGGVGGDGGGAVLGGADLGAGRGGARASEASKSHRMGGACRLWTRAVEVTDAAVF